MYRHTTPYPKTQKVHTTPRAQGSVPHLARLYEQLTMSKGVQAFPGRVLPVPAVAAGKLVKERLLGACRPTTPTAAAQQRLCCQTHQRKVAPPCGLLTTGAGRRRRGGGHAAVASAALWRHRYLLSLLALHVALGVMRTRRGWLAPCQMHARWCMRMLGGGEGTGTTDSRGPQLNGQANVTRVDADVRRLYSWPRCPSKCIDTRTSVHLA